MKTMFWGKDKSETITPNESECVKNLAPSMDAMPCCVVIGMQKILIGSSSSNPVLYHCSWEKDF